MDRDLCLIVNRTEVAPRADVVVVGAHQGLSYDEIKIAAQAVIRGAELIGATRDASVPMPDGPWPVSYTHLTLPTKA